MQQRGNTLVEGPVTYNNKADGSGTTTRNFAGTEAEIRALEITYRTSGYDTVVEEGSPWKLTATLSYSLLTNQLGQEPEPFPQWSVVPNAQEQNILESDVLLSRIIKPANKARILAALKNPDRPGTMFDADDNEEQRVATRVMHALMSLGADKKRLTTISVSRTITVSKTYVSTWDLQHDGKVLSKGTLVAMTAMPNWVQILLPESVHAKQLSTDVYINKGYLQETPSYQNISNNQVQISQTWIYNDWMLEYYTWV